MEGSNLSFVSLLEPIHWGPELHSLASPSPQSLAGRELLVLLHAWHSVTTGGLSSESAWPSVSRWKGKRESNKTSSMSMMTLMRATGKGGELESILMENLPCG